MSELIVGINTGQIEEFEKAIEGATRALAEFGKSASEISKVSSAIMDATNIAANVTTVFAEGEMAIKNGIAVAKIAVEGFGKAVTVGMELGTRMVDGFGQAVKVGMGLASKAVAGFGKALEFLKNNPLLIIAAVFAAVTAACVAAYKAGQENNSVYDESRRQATALKEKMEDLSQTYRDSAQARKDAIDSLGGEAVAAKNLTDRLAELMESSEGTAKDNIKIQATVEQLNRVLPELGLAYNEATGELSKNTDEIYNYIDAMKEKAYSEAVSNNLTAAISDQIKMQRQLTEATDAQGIAEQNLTDAENKLEEVTRRMNTAAGDKIAVKAWKEANAAVKDAQKAYDDASLAVDGYKDTLGEVEKEVTYFEGLMVANAEKQVELAEKERAAAEKRQVSQTEYNALLAEESEARNNLNTAIGEQETATNDLAIAQNALDDLIANNKGEYTDEIETATQALFDAKEEVRRLDGEVENFEMGLEAATAAIEGSIVASDSSNDSLEELEGEYKSLDNTINRVIPDLGNLSDAHETAAESAHQEAGHQEAAGSNMDAAIDETYAKGPELSEAAQEVAIDAADSAAEKGEPAFKALGGAIDDGVATGIEENAHIVDGTLGPKTVDAIKATEALANNSAPDIGKAIADGTTRGIETGIPAVVEAARRMARSAYDAAMAALNAHSPSRLFKYVGKDVIAKGQAIGIESGIPYVTGAIEGMTGAMVNKSVRLAGTVNQFAWGPGNMPATEIGGSLLGRLAVNSGGMDYERIGSLFNTAAERIAGSVHGMEVAFYDREMRRVVLGAIK